MFVKSTLRAAMALLAASPSVAHMTMKYPAPILAQNNPNTPSGGALDTYTAPMSGRSQFPCRDQKVTTAIASIGSGEATSVDTWNAGETRNVTITGGAFHGGGSCQLSLSYDQATTFKVIKSFIGNCPSANGDTNYDVTIPSDAPSGDAVFAWTWFNKIGNREMYMNCAVITIAGGSSKREIKERAVAFDQRPNIFVANIDGSTGCQTKETIDVDFPNPGEDVVRDTTTPGLYVDESLCSDPDNTGAGTPGPVGDNSGSGGSSSSAGAADPTSTGAAATSTGGAATSTGAADTSSTTIPGGVFVTTPTGSDAATSTTAASTTATSASTSDVAANPTTLLTSTVAATTTAAASPSSTTTPDTSGAFTAGTACTDEGQWNCIGGSSFQRCASGMWSSVLSMAAGTSCEAGVSDTIVMHRKRGGSRIIAA